jgi:uncharacterized membrane protein
MNLDLFPLGWVHLLASLAALAVGMLVLLRAKGTPVHKQRGRVYAQTLLVTAVTALGIYRRGIFFFPHWLAITALLSRRPAFLRHISKSRRRSGCTCT